MQRWAQVLHPGLLRSQDFLRHLQVQQPLLARWTFLCGVLISSFDFFRPRFFPFGFRGVLIVGDGCDSTDGRLLSLPWLDVVISGYIAVLSVVFGRLESPRSTTFERPCGYGFSALDGTSMVDSDSTG